MKHSRWQLDRSHASDNTRNPKCSLGNTRHQKLYRVPPEYVRSRSAMEEFQKATQEEPPNKIGDQSMRPNHWGVQYHDLIPSRQASARVPADATGTGRDLAGEMPLNRIGAQHAEQPPIPPSIISRNSEQPDNEPEVQSIPSSHSPIHDPLPIPDVNAPVEVPVPETSDEESLKIFPAIIFTVTKCSDLKWTSINGM